MPACPYAQGSWERGEVSVIITADLGRAATLKKDIPPQGRQTYVVAWTNPSLLSAEQFDRWIEQQNTIHDGVWLMGFHPDAPDNEAIDVMSIDIDYYAVILIQRLDVVVQAAAALGKTGYYSDYTEDELHTIYQREQANERY